MIGFYGIFRTAEGGEAAALSKAFEKMTASSDESLCRNRTVSWGRLQIGWSGRVNGSNQDFALHDFPGGARVAFFGYGRLPGQAGFCWADQMSQNVLRLLQAGDLQALHQLQGSFLCVALWKDELIILSDRFGSKALFYYADRDYILFAPDIVRIAKSGLVPIRQNRQAISQFLATGYFLNRQTPIERIERFPAATLFRQSPGAGARPHATSYWAPPAEEGSKTDLTQDLVMEFAERFRSAVLNLAGLEPRFVVSLSGGLDSRAIACFLSASGSAYEVVTYDSSDEKRIAERVSRKLGVNSHFFSNATVASSAFSKRLREFYAAQPVQTVINQCFYGPLFEEYFKRRPGINAIFDGVLLDVFFSSADFTCEQSKCSRNYFLKRYGSSSIELLSQYTLLKGKDVLEALDSALSAHWARMADMKDLQQHQYLYLQGRLPSYVNEAVRVRELFGYVLAPGYDYDLFDFAQGISNRLRIGVLYLTLLGQLFPDIMKIRFIDSYGVLPESKTDKIITAYHRLRYRASCSSRGLIPYYKYQTDLYFLKYRRTQDFKHLFYNGSYLPEIFSENQIEKLFQDVSKKQYLLDLFQRVLFLQQFFSQCTNRTLPPVQPSSC